MSEENRESRISDSTQKAPQKKPIVPLLILFLAVSINALLLIGIMIAIVGKMEKDTPEESQAPSKTDVVIMDSDFGEVTIDDYSNVQKSQFDSEFLKEENGLRYYTKEGIHSKVGVDVSDHLDEIDWNAVKEYGIDFAMIRVGWRGYETGKISEDACFRDNIQGALDAGLEVGVYFFSQATCREEAKEEADFVVNILKDYSITYPVAYDWERIDKETSRAKDIESKELTACAKTFCATIKEAGYDPMVYFYKHLAYFRYDLSELAEYAFWYSKPEEKPSFYFDFSMWQYSTDASVPGIRGNADLNLYIGK